MRLALADAHSLAVDVLRRHKLSEQDAGIVADHLVDAHLTGHTFAGLPRLLVVLDRMKAEPKALEPIEVVHETPLSASLDGHRNLGYLVCRRAVDVAIEKCRASGIAVVGAFNSYYSGRSGYYTERAAREGMVAIHASSAFAMVAPAGGRDPVLGSNPFTVAFPAPEHPVVVDISTAAITWGELQMAAHTGEQVPAGVAIDSSGQSTRDPGAALLGAALPWGGHKGYALGVAVQLLAVLAGGDAVPEPFGNFGFLFVLFRPDMLISRVDYDRRVGELLDALRSSAPAPGSPGVAVPGDGSSARRERGVAAGFIDVPDAVHAALTALRA